MLTTLREYAQEQLAAGPDELELGRRHATYFASVVDAAEPELRGGASRHAYWLDRLQVEHDEIRAALRWAVRNRQAALGLRIGGAIWRFWWVRGYATEGRELLAALLAMPETHEQPAGRAGVLNGAGALAGHQHDSEAARRYFGESLAIRDRIGDRAGVAATLSNLGHDAWLRADADEARRYLERALAIRRDLGDEQGVAQVLTHLGNVFWLRGDVEDALAMHRESLATFRRVGSEWHSANSLSVLGYLALERTDHRAAREHFEQSLTLWRLGFRHGLALLVGGFAGAALSASTRGMAHARFQRDPFGACWNGPSASFSVWLSFWKT
jgi:tetratricopeptide (TPR) repeat protein